MSREMTTMKPISDMTVDEMTEEYTARDTDGRSNLYKTNPRRYCSIAEQLWKVLMLQWHGLIPYTGKGAICPRRLVGKHCIGIQRRTDCLCHHNYNYGSDVYDHFGMWRDKDTQELVMTSEPYTTIANISQKNRFIRFVRDCEAMGIDVTLSEKSPYGHPYNDVVLILMRTRHAPDSVAN